jgi:hypothetical protein
MQNYVKTMKNHTKPRQIHEMTKLCANSYLVIFKDQKFKILKPQK